MKEIIARRYHKSLKAFLAQFNWINLSFVVPMHILGIVAWPIYLLMGGGVHWQELFVFVFMYALGAIGIDLGYHRSFTHRSFKMSPLMKFVSLFGAASVAEGSAFTWCSDHRRHHKFQDTDADPYNINRGFWWAHIGWVFVGQTSTDFANIPDLTRDKMMQNQHRYYTLWLVVSCFLLPIGLGMLIGRPLACFLLGGLTRLFLINHATFLINSYAHYFGKRPYSIDITARDSLICAILAQGEGWHNFHHKFPFDYRNGHRFYHYDPAKWAIYFGKFFGLTSDLKKTPDLEIYRAKIQTQKAEKKIECAKTLHLSEALDSALHRWDRIQQEWNEFKTRAKEHDFALRAQLHEKLEEAQQHFRQVYAEWRSALKNLPDFAS